MTTEAEQRLIPSGYRLVLDGFVRAGDKYWVPKWAAWMPITVNTRYRVAVFPAVIRMEKPCDLLS